MTVSNRWLQAMLDNDPLMAARLQARKGMAGLFSGAVTRRHVQKMGAADNCCDGIDYCACFCQSCRRNCGACCYEIVVGASTYTVFWSGACEWRDENGAVVVMTMVGRDLTITIGAVTYATTIPLQADCLNFSSLEVPRVGGGVSAYVTADGASCSTCGCHCDDCASPGETYNAACCYVFGYGNQAVRLSLTGSCTWTGFLCRPTKRSVTLTVSSSAITLNIGGTVYSTPVVSAPDCCGPIAVGPFILFPGGEYCENITKLCYTITVAGVTTTGDDCACPACDGINGTYTIGPDGHGSMGSSPICAYGNWSLVIGDNVVTVALSDCAYYDVLDPTATAFVRWTNAGTVTPGNPVVLPLDFATYTFDDGLECDFSGSTVTVSATEVDCVCPPGEEPCQFPITLPGCTATCYAESMPGAYNFDTPAGYIYDNTGFTPHWCNFRCAADSLCADMPDNATVVLLHELDNPIEPETYTTSDYGGGTATLQLWYGTQNSPCQFSYFSQIYACEYYDGGANPYHVCVSQWRVMYNLGGSCWFTYRVKTAYTVAASGNTWYTTTSPAEYVWQYAVSLPEVCDSSAYDCWSPTITAVSSYPPYVAGLQCYPQPGYGVTLPTLTAAG